MECDEALARAAELGDPEACDAVVAAHIAACAGCRAALDEARDAAATLTAFERTTSDPDLPPADADAAWRTARSPASRPLLRRAFATSGRIAAAVLAGVGGLALLGARVESSDGRTTLVLTLPWSAADAPTHVATRSDASARDVVVAVLREEVAPRLDAVLRRIDASDEAHARGVADVADSLQARADEDVRVLVSEIIALRREVTAMRSFQSSMEDAAAAMPALPDPR